MNVAYLRALAVGAPALLAFIGLVDVAGQELSAQPYARRRASWQVDDDGTVHLATDLTFDVPPGVSIAGWRAYSSARDGIDYGGAPLKTERFEGQGQYTLLASKTGVSHREGGFE